MLSIFIHENAYCIQHMSLRLTYAMKDERCRGRRLWVIFWQVLRARKLLRTYVCTYVRTYVRIMSFILLPMLRSLAAESQCFHLVRILRESVVGRRPEL